MKPTTSVRKALNPEDVRQGATLRTIRELRGYRAVDFATALLITPGHLCNIEAGRNRLTAPLLAKAAAALDVPQIALALPPAEPAKAAA